ncbi:MAG: NAD(P)(+) transhydrogenase (Re/Si-specific) subunit beta, partial [Limnohabitans sp.]
MSMNLVTLLYLVASVFFIQALKGLSHPTTSIRGNVFGMAGMTIAVLATIMGPQVTAAGYGWIAGALAIGAAIGIYAARTVKM